MLYEAMLIHLLGALTMREVRKRKFIEPDAGWGIIIIEQFNLWRPGKRLMPIHHPGLGSSQIEAIPYQFTSALSLVFGYLSNHSA
jgi:hypothetical protein